MAPIGKLWQELNHGAKTPELVVLFSVEAPSARRSSAGEVAAVTDSSYHGPERRSNTRDQATLVAEIIKAVQESQPASLNEEELRWVRLAIQVEAQRLRLRQAIIEKTLAGLVWMALIAAGYILLDYFQARGLNLKPK